MPRQARLDAPGLLQHVMARGIERREIFKDNKDRQSFLERLAVILEETQTQCYAWALIPNHFHLLLRTGPTPLSIVMRRLMTGYAVTFNKRHKRSGHLFQNRYKSVVCEEDPYLLELIRYIHLNPLRAGLVKDLKELDKYRWTGHSVILGRRKNPLAAEVRDQRSEVSNPKTLSIPSDKGGLFFQFHPETEKDNKHPENPVNPVKAKSLAEKTVEDVLLFFGDNLRESRRRYRQFVKKGIDQGKRPELQGGGLVRSAGGNKAGLLGRKKEERELGDARILGSGDFVSNILDQADNDWDRRQRYHISLNEVISKVANGLNINEKHLLSSRRQSRISDARAIICYLGVMELGLKGTHVGRALRISGQSVSRCLDRGRNLIDKGYDLYQYLQ